VWPRATRATDLPWHIGLIQVARDNAVALFMVSLVAGAATGPFAIQHFNRIANFGVFANLTADLVASVAMMPALAMALLAELFNHNAALGPLWVAGWAARGVVTLGHLFATAPNAGMAASTAPQIALILSYLGILFACLWKGHLRWLGVPLAAAVALWPRPPVPPIWIASDGADAAIALKGQEVVLRPGVRSYATGVWAQRRGLTVPTDAGAARSALFDCDYWSCVAKSGVTPALGVWWTRREPKPDRLGELCEGADILVIRADAVLPGSCRDALVLRPTDFAAGGAAELYPAGKTWRVVWSQPIRGQRPWTHASE
jgi:competence protein ComEC